MKSDITQRHIRRMDLNLLWVLYALLRDSKVTTAAERLAMTQSAVSQALARLRSTFSDPLFLRTGHGLKPTPRALELEPAVTQIIETAVSSFGTKSSLDSSRRMDMRIGMSDKVSPALTSFIAETWRAVPGLRFSIRDVWGPKGVQALMDDEIDLALFHVAEAPPEIEQQVLYYESFAVVAR